MKKKLGFHMSSVLSGRVCGSVCMGEQDDNDVDDDDADGGIDQSHSIKTKLRG